MSFISELWHIWLNSKHPSNNEEWIIEYGGKFWDGSKFKKNKDFAIRFRNKDDADFYAENSFSEYVYEDISYWRVKND